MYQSKIETNLLPYCCPVCLGKGLVEAGFYLVAPNQTHTSSSAALEKCKSCSGTGIVWSPEPSTTAETNSHNQSTGELS